MAEKFKVPLIKFTLFALIVNILCWAGFTLYDWAIDENLSDRMDLITEQILFFVALFLPAILSVVFYFLLEKHFVSENRNNVLNTFFQILIWTGICLSFSAPICNAVNYRKWIIKQQPADYLDLNGIEYYLFAFIYSGVFIVFVPLIQAIRFAVKKHKAKNQS